MACHSLVFIVQLVHLRAVNHCASRLSNNFFIVRKKYSLLQKKRPKLIKSPKSCIASVVRYPYSLSSSLLFEISCTGDSEKTKNNLPSFFVILKETLNSLTLEPQLWFNEFSAKVWPPNWQNTSHLPFPNAHVQICKILCTNQAKNENRCVKVRMKLDDLLNCRAILGGDMEMNCARFAVKLSRVITKKNRTRDL